MVLLEAAARGAERSRRFRASLTANLMNCWVKRGHQVSVDQLVGPPRNGGGGRRLSGMTDGEREKWLEDRRAARQERATGGRQV